MNYRDTLDAIEQTELQLHRVKEDARDLRKFCAKHGCYDEEKAEEQWERQQGVRQALSSLYAQLPLRTDL